MPLTEPIISRSLLFVFSAPSAFPAVSFFPNEFRVSLFAFRW